MSEQLKGLITWLNTFELQASHSTAMEISTGNALAEALTQIAPEWFTSEWNSKIKSHVTFNSNWRLKVSNIKKVISSVNEYYLEGLNQILPEYVKPNAQEIGENCDKQELKKLIQLVLGCAVNCNRKQYFINIIMGLEQSVQEVIMQCILELQDSIETNLSMESFTITDDTQKLVAELQATEESRNKMAQRCYELKQQLLSMQEDKNVLQAENRELLKRLYKFKNEENDTSSEDSLSFKNLNQKREEELKNRFMDLHINHVNLHAVSFETCKLLRESTSKLEKFELIIKEDKKRMKDLERQLQDLRDESFEILQSKFME